MRAGRRRPLIERELLHVAKHLGRFPEGLPGTREGFMPEEAATERMTAARTGIRVRALWLWKNELFARGSAKRSPSAAAAGRLVRACVRSWALGEENAARWRGGGVGGRRCRRRGTEPNGTLTLSRPCTPGNLAVFAGASATVSCSVGCLLVIVTPPRPASTVPSGPLAGSQGATDAGARIRGGYRLPPLPVFL